MRVYFTQQGANHLLVFAFYGKHGAPRPQGGARGNVRAGHRVQLQSLACWAAGPPFTARSRAEPYYVQPSRAWRRSRTRTFDRDAAPHMFITRPGR